MNGLAHPSSSPQFCTPIQPEGIHQINPAPLTRLRLSARACPGPPSEFSIHFSDAPADHSPDVLAVTSCAAPTSADTPSLPEHGPGLVGGTITLDDASFTTKITVHSGTTASTVFGCVALLDTGSPQTFTHRDVLEQMLAGRAVAFNCEQGSAPRSWGGFGKSTSLRTSTSIRLSVEFFRAEQPTSSLAVWACVVPLSIMQHAVLLRRDSRMRLNTRSYRSFPPRPSDQRVFGEMTLSHHAPTGASDFVPGPLASGGGFHLRYDGADRVTLSDEPQLLAINFVRSNGLPALTGHYFVEKLPQPDLLLAEEHVAASGRQVLHISSAADLEPGDLLGVAHAPLMRAPIAVFQYGQCTSRLPETRLR